MTTFSSIQYTIGTALNHAREGRLLVEVLVEGHWLEGLVVATDGLGVVLENGGHEHCVVRLERVSAVRVGAEAPSGIRDEDARFGSAMPMTGPRAATG